MKKPICIYHKDCPDGFGSAWIMRRFFGPGNVDFHAAHHGSAPPDVQDRNVYIVDFSYPADVLRAMVAEGGANAVTVLDHHATAERDLVEFTRDREGPVYAIFDMERSGIGIAWEFCFPDKPLPPVLARLEDYDLYWFAYPTTRAVKAGVCSYPFDFAVWDCIVFWSIERLEREGHPILRAQARQVRQLLDHVRVAEIGGEKVPLVNAPYWLANDVCDALLIDGRYPFAATYFATADRLKFSLRSRNGYDVSRVAATYGGGGHPAASGFGVPVGRFAGIVEPSDDPDAAA